MGHIDMDYAGWFAGEWCNALNASDLDRVMALYAPDIAFQSPSVPIRWGIEDGWLRGREQLRENFAKGLQTPGLRFELIGYTLGLGCMCYFYRRETGALGSDQVSFNEQRLALKVIACYGPTEDELSDALKAHR